MSEYLSQHRLGYSLDDVVPDDGRDRSSDPWVRETTPGILAAASSIALIVLELKVPEGSAMGLRIARGEVDTSPMPASKRRRCGKNRQYLVFLLSRAQRVHCVVPTIQRELTHQPPPNGSGRTRYLCRSRPSRGPLRHNSGLGYENPTPAQARTHLRLLLFRGGHYLCSGPDRHTPATPGLRAPAAQQDCLRRTPGDAGSRCLLPHASWRFRSPSR